MNAYLNSVKAILAPDIRKPNSVFLYLDKFQPFFPNSTSPPSTSTSSILLPSSPPLSRPALLPPPTPTTLFLDSANSVLEVFSYNVMITGPADHGLHVIFLATAMSSSSYYLIVATTLSSYLRDLASQSP